MFVVPEKYEAICEQMGLKTRPAVVIRDKGERLRAYGRYNPSLNRIELFSDHGEYGINRLRAVNLELVDTLLHELRHAWQDQEWEKDHYTKNVVRAEVDADDFAKRNVAAWRGLIRVERMQQYRKLPG